MSLLIHIDGGSRGNPGPAAAGVVIHDDRNRLLHRGGYLLDEMTNNQAEYNALLIALRTCRAWNDPFVEIRADSELLVKQITGQYQVKSQDLKPLYEEAIGLLLKLDNWSIKHIKREFNGEADAMANAAMDAGQDVIMTDVIGGRSAPVEAAPPVRVTTVAVVIDHPPDPAGCPAPSKSGTRYRFNAACPTGICVHACRAVIDAVVARQVSAPDHPSRSQPDPIPCDRANCHATFRIQDVD
jgi:ribonuclease HI